MIILDWNISKYHTSCVLTYSRTNIYTLFSCTKFLQHTNLQRVGKFKQQLKQLTHNPWWNLLPSCSTNSGKASVLSFTLPSKSLPTVWNINKLS